MAANGLARSTQGRRREGQGEDSSTPGGLCEEEASFSGHLRVGVREGSEPQGILRE
jgi:hypothetical protein